MFPWLKSFFWDQQAFQTAVANGITYIRAVVLLLGLQIAQGTINLGPHTTAIGTVVASLSLLLRAGDKNIPLTTQISQLGPDEKARVVTALKP
jgi:hypothetical protein